MRKSPLANIGANTQKPTRARRISNVFNFDLLRPVLKLYTGITPPVDFSLLYKYDCQKDGEIMEVRVKVVLNLAKVFDGLIKDGGSHDYLYSRYTCFKTYVFFCDRNGLDPLSENGYRAYAGNNGELRRLIALANRPLPYLFMYEDGQEMGISESTASQTDVIIRSMLVYCGVYSSHWGSGISQYLSGNPNYTVPYTTNKEGTGELDKSLRRLQFYFFSLASQLIAYKKENPNLPPPKSLYAIVDENYNGQPIEIEVKGYSTGVSNAKTVKLASPFNRAIQAGYYLFAYYTSFNSSSILDVRHPVEVITDKKEGRTLKHTTVRGFKGRSNKSVDALFSDYSVTDIPKASDESAGYITAEVDKKDGLSFIEALSTLSALYNEAPHGKLFYLLTNEAEPKDFGSYSSDFNLSKELGLYSESRSGVTDYLVDCFYLALKEGIWREVSVPNDGKLGRKVSNVKVELNHRSRRYAVNRFIFAALRSMTDIELKNIIMPLSYSAIDYDGNITVSFSYEDSSHGEFKAQLKHLSFLKEVEAFSETINPTKLKNGRRREKPAYLIPIGERYKTYQWEGLELTAFATLKNRGIGSGDFFLDLSAKRFRATTGNNFYDPSDSGYSLSKHILQHSMNVLHDRYANGHPDQNNLILSQSLQVLEEWARTKDIDEAILSVKSKLKIAVLEHEEWKALRMPTNINGVLCNGEPDIDGKNYHRDAKRYAKKLLGDESDSIACYQFDMCVYCKSAKLVDDTQAAYKFLSFIELLEEAVDRMPTQASRLVEKAHYFKLIAEQNFSLDVFEEAEERVMNEGRYPMLNDDFIYTMNGVDNA
jgi:hypothetical protein